MTDKTTPSTESDTADATRSAPRALPSQRGAAPRAGAQGRRRCGRAGGPPARCGRRARRPAAPPRRRARGRRPPGDGRRAGRHRPPLPGRRPRPGQEALRAVIEELSPDDARAVHRALLEVNVQACRPPQSGRRAGRGLARGHLSLPPPHAAAQLRKAEVRAAGRAAQAAGLGQGHRPARGDPVRGARRGRQGRDHQAHDGTPEPARRARGRAGKPSDTERGQWYFQRYVQHLPTAGEIVMFDRSWYNRAGVERVMGFCDQAEYLSSCVRCRTSSGTWCPAASTWSSSGSR